MLTRCQRILVICLGVLLYGFCGTQLHDYLYGQTEGRVRLSDLPPPTAPAAAHDGQPARSVPRSVQRVSRTREATPDHRGWGGSTAYPVPPHLVGVNLINQSREDALAKSHGCVRCHADAHDPHYSPALHIGCTDCHGGNATAHTKHEAHVHPRLANVFRTSANPVRSYTALNHEDPEFIRFINPSDLRVVHLSCGTTGCHGEESLQVRKSMMTHGCMLWGAALYNNGAVPNKWPRYGESYSMYGTPQRLQTVPPPTPEETATKGILPYLDPLPRFQVTQPGNILRIFERGGRFPAQDIGVFERLEEPGRPRNRLSNRGLGTGTRTDPVFLGLQKTRLLDPTLNFMGTNDHPGDYRNSGCAACHMIYANDRSPVHSGPYAKHGNRGRAATHPDHPDDPDRFVISVDPTIPTHESGHPIAHRFTSRIPTSQCIVCHIHPGTTVMNSYLGYMWWDLETDGELMYPRHGVDLSSEEFLQSQMSNPNDAAARGKWRDPEFLAESSRLNNAADKTQFADFHGHGWMFRAVFKKASDGTLLDKFGNRIPDADARARQLAVKIPEHVKELYRNVVWSDPVSRERLKARERELNELRRDVPVHLMDIHLEKGMHCVDCHFVQDVHGDTKLYGEVRAAIEIQCTDCHGTVTNRAFQMVDGVPQMRTSGPAAREPRDAGGLRGRNLAAMTTPFGKRRFEIHDDGRIVQNSMVEAGLSWEVSQVADVIDPANEDEYNPLAALAKTVRMTPDGRFRWGDVPDESECAHQNQHVSCIACHSAWNPSCYGCHLPQKADKKMPNLHNEGDVTKNYISYNFQTLRDQTYMLAKDGNVTGNRIGPSRSSCAIHVGSYNANRESVYVQQQTISAEGLSGIAFSTNVPHTVRGKGETKSCNDCHLSSFDDNNAQMAQLLMQGTQYLNFVGKYCWVGAGDHGLFGVQVTERSEPQSVIGSTMHELAYPEHYEEHVEHHRELEEAHEHPAKDIGESLLTPWQQPEVRSLQLRGEYLYAACGEAGVRIFDVAFIDHKGFSERITTAPVSPVGQRFYVRTRCATSVAAPTTIAPDPTRTHRPENHEPDIHSVYAYIYASDKYEGLILIGAATLLDGNPTNNFVERKLTFNPGGILAGARSVRIVGTFAYVCCDQGLVVISLADPLKPVVTSVLGKEQLDHPTSVQVQFRYAFVTDHSGLKVLDVTDLSHPFVAASLPLHDAHSVYVARTYAYVAGGRHGLYIVDVKNPLAPRLDQVFTAGGVINDLHDVKLGITYSSEFAYLADGRNGLRVVQLTSPETHGNYGFSPRPTPKLIATHTLEGGHAYAVSEGVDRDRAVDESGNQIAVFGRVGARPLNKVEQERLYRRPGGSVWKTLDLKRDYRIPEAREREAHLHRQLEAYYGPSRHPAARALPARLRNTSRSVPAVGRASYSSPQ